MRYDKNIIYKDLVFVWNEELKKGLSKKNTLILTNPITSKFFIEEEVTNGLGYYPVRELFEEEHKDTPYGLIEHLANMDKTLLYRDSFRNEICLKSLMVIVRDLDINYTKISNAVHELYDASHKLFDSQEVSGYTKKEENTSDNIISVPKDSFLVKAAKKVGLLG